MPLIYLGPQALTSLFLCPGCTSLWLPNSEPQARWEWCDTEQGLQCEPEHHLQHLWDPEPSRPWFSADTAGWLHWNNSIRIFYINSSQQAHFLRQNIGCFPISSRVSRGRTIRKTGGQRTLTFGGLSPSFVSPCPVSFPGLFSGTSLPLFFHIYLFTLYSYIHSLTHSLIPLPSTHWCDAHHMPGTKINDSI